MKNRKSLIDEQLNEEELYNLYYKYVLESNIDEWITGACYIRVSTHEQDKFSPLSQLKEILEYSLNHNIYIPKEFIFKDIGKSGMKNLNERQDFLKLMELAKNRPFTVLVLYNFSRFARNKEDSVYYKAKLRKEYKIDVISVREMLPKDNTRVLVESIYEGKDEYYALNFRDETKRGKKEKLTRGEWLGPAPYGYGFDKNTQTLYIIEERAEIVKYIFETFLNMPNKNIRSLVEKLNSKKIASPKGGLWSDLSVKRILQNPAYIGLMRHCDGGFKRDYNNPNIQLFKGKHPPILEKNIFDEVQIEMKKLSKKHRKYIKPAAMHAHWLSGILKCDNCGYTLVRIATKSRKPYFQCTGYTKSYCTISHHIREEIVVDLVLNQLKRDYSMKLDINITKELEDYNTEIVILNTDLKKLETKLKRIKIAYQDGIDTLEEYKDNKNKINNQIESIKEKIKTLENNQDKNNDKEIIYKKCAEVYKILKDEKAPLELKRTIANELFDKIVYVKSNEELLIYYRL